MVIVFLVFLIDFVLLNFFRISVMVLFFLVLGLLRGFIMIEGFYWLFLFLNYVVDVVGCSDCWVEVIIYFILF